MTDKWMPLEYMAGEAMGAATTPACPDIDDDEAVDQLLAQVRRFGKPAEPPTFNDIADAFDYCREAAKPIKAVVDGVCFKLFPSGYFEWTAPAAPAADCYDCATCPALADQHCLGR